MIRDYKVTGKLIPGAVYLRYEHGALTAMMLEFNGQINEQIWQSFKTRMGYSENMKLLSETFDVRELNSAKSLQDKIVLFCSSYKHYRNVPYKPKELEKANLKNVPVTRELLDTFFKSPLANYTLDNYIRRINITRDWNKNGMNNHLADAFPDEWNEDYSRTLDGERLSKYYTHLIALGWKKDDRGIWKRIAAILLFALFTSCAPQPVKQDPRYRQPGDKYLNEWLDAEFPRKVKPTVEAKKRKRNHNR
jgi:hypothetical protein